MDYVGVAHERHCIFSVGPVTKMPGPGFAKEALEDFHFVLSQFPSMARAHLNVFAVHKQLGNVKEAEWALSQV